MPSAGLECPIRRRRTVGPTLSLLGADDTAVTLSLLSADDTADKGIVNYHTLRVRFRDRFPREGFREKVPHGHTALDSWINPTHEQLCHGNYHDRALVTVA